MKKLFFLAFIILSYSSCKSSKRAKGSQSSTSSSKVIIENRSVETSNENITLSESRKAENLASPESKTDGIVDYAKQFQGVRYKFGGTTEKGMDCSGLVFESYRAYNVILPRISRDMAKRGEKIHLRQVEKGDLLFFKTGNRRNDINHVGLVVSSENGTIKFIHATSSAGVIISSIAESYWEKAFEEARRIL
ncbi:C40 family peptidase [Flavobacteriaceae bacterium XHP0103]|uniref:C40 family peptidase n=1 Tax=Marixanthotalea marina TaxID=2844359 RepID=UPI002989DAA5|nr:C40 family peptidase [Marixanthotalea marina]MBU3821054.1 C40 family peptidase [Marixanthotalea marina]